MVECLNCGKRRHEPEHECPRCSYVGWAFVEEIDEGLRRRLRTRVVSERRTASFGTVRSSGIFEAPPRLGS
jgi:uncharacterized OB-fold protein